MSRIRRTHIEHAQIAKAQGLLHHDKAVAIADVVAAGAIVGRLPAKSEARARLTAEVLEAALPLVRAQSGATDGATSCSGVLSPRTESDVASKTSIARWPSTAAPGRERIELVDRANRVRPRSLV